MCRHEFIFLQGVRIFIQKQFIRIRIQADAQMKFRYNHFGLSMWRFDLVRLASAWRFRSAEVTDVISLSHMFTK